MLTKELSFYKQPFRINEYSHWVYDAKGHFVCQFETKFNEKGDYANGELERQAKVIESLNSKEHSPVEELDLRVDSNESIMILNHNEPFILIRGWGRLTGIEGYRFTVEKAAKIQDDFRDWIIYKLSKI